MHSVSLLVQKVAHQSRQRAGTIVSRLPRKLPVSLLKSIGRRTAAHGEVPLEPGFEARLDIPFCDVSADEAERQDHQIEGQFLARQDRWEELSQRIRESEAARRTTTGGMPVADLLAFGARSDVIHAAEDIALSDGTEWNAGLLDGITALEEVFQDHCEDHAIAMVLALAHIDIGWIRRSGAARGQLSQADAAAFTAHFGRAAELLDRFCAIELDAPGLAAARCALLAGQSDPHTRVIDDYEDLIDLDPGNYRHLRAMGNHLLPQWFGDYDQLELEARRAASRTQDVWGNAAYTWTMFDAIAIDDTACARVDVAFFLDGLRDILRYHPDQATVNLLAAYCSTALARRSGLCDAADKARTPIMDAADWIIRDHLKEVHPLVWAHAAEGFDNAARVTSLNRFAAKGRAGALRVIGELFRDDIARGRHVVFTENGPRLHA